MSAGISGLIANTVELLVNAVSVFKVNGDGAIGVNDSYGEAGQVLKSGGSGASAEYGSAINSSAAVTASGTAIDFTGIPSWAKRVTVMLDRVSTNGTSVVQFQLGSGVVQTIGYTGGFANSYTTNQTQVGAFSSGFSTGQSGATQSRIGVLTINKHSGNRYTCSGVVSEVSGGSSSIGGGVQLSGTLDRLRITTVNGTDTFDAGTISISWE